MASDRLKSAFKLMDEANSGDPNQVFDEQGKQWPKELLYSVRMTDMLNRYVPNADEVAQLSMRGQHIQRWKSPRNAFPMNRQGYFQWRTQLYKFHANTTAKIIQQLNYDDETVERVRKAISKKGIKVNADSQLLEDVADLVFIEHYMQSFVDDHPDYDEDKWIDIIKKTWKKMSERGQQFALSGDIKLPEALVPLIKRALDV